VSTVVAALIVQPDGTAEIRDIDPDFMAIKEVLNGGWLEAIHPRDPGFGQWHAYVDEEGKLKGLPINPAATAFAQSIGWWSSDALCGPVVFLGDKGPDEGDVPPEVVGLAVKLWGLPTH
jgi:hypothetical protein